MTKKKLDQIILRIDDKFGHHIIRTNGASYTIEGYPIKPENYQAAPSYFLPIEKSDVKTEFEKEGKVFCDK